tara:strand:- start:1024 stop:1626 length:603 start_codon:yes stop_codon:yes gene_type:complete
MLWKIIAGFGLITCILVFSHSTDYSFEGVDVYSTLESLVQSLEDNGIEYYLGAGSALGAARRGGILKGDKDVDIFVANTAPIEIENALWGFDWKYTDFGYHVNLPKTNFYFDIWVMQEKYGKLICVGAAGKCHLWEEKYNWAVQVPITMVLPPKKRNFGGLEFNFPNQLYAYLDQEFPGWGERCGGWRIGNRPCTEEDFE